MTKSPSTPFLSVCIPAYKRTHYLKRLLQSLTEQSFRDFEVILSDDSNDDSVQKLAEEYSGLLPLSYYHNAKALGTPANWNFAIGKAKGEWIKLLHDDDWLDSPASLQAFADATKENKKFIFSAYTNNFETTHNTEEVSLPSFFKQKIKTNPSLLIVKNVIGPPSVTLVHRSIAESYDERLKWRVDTDFYERVLRSEGDYHYISKPLINVGISESQVTQSCLYKPEVELPEGLILLRKYGVSSLSHILVYDAWWRLFRNMNIKSEADLMKYTNEPWPRIITTMLKHLARVPVPLLQRGATSKLMMSVSFVLNRNKI